MIVIGESKIEEELEKAIKRANKLIEKELDADADAAQARDRCGGPRRRAFVVIPLLLALRTVGGAADATPQAANGGQLGTRSGRLRLGFAA